MPTLIKPQCGFWPFRAALDAWDTGLSRANANHGEMTDAVSLVSSSSPGIGPYPISFITVSLENPEARICVISGKRSPSEHKTIMTKGVFASEWMCVYSTLAAQLMTAQIIRFVLKPLWMRYQVIPTRRRLCCLATAGHQALRPGKLCDNETRNEHRVSECAGM